MTTTDTDTDTDRGAGAATISIAEHWGEIVTVALLGTDRRDPPEPVGPLADLVADTARAAPSERMLAQLAACVAARRAGIVPRPPVAAMAPPPPDDRPPCVPAAVERWGHVVASWPVLEDEWMVTLVEAGWRLAPELVPPMLRRHRTDPVRRARVVVAAGPVAEWLVEHVPTLAGSRATLTPTEEELAAVGELRPLPIPPELADLVTAPGPEAAPQLADAIASGMLGASHRAVLVNVVARMRPDGLGPLADALAAVALDPASPGHALAGVLADLATTRRRMLDELRR